MGCACYCCLPGINVPPSCCLQAAAHVSSWLCQAPDASHAARPLENHGERFHSSRVMSQPEKTGHWRSAAHAPAIHVQASRLAGLTPAQAPLCVNASAAGCNCLGACFRLDSNGNSRVLAHVNTGGSTGWHSRTHPASAPNPVGNPCLLVHCTAKGTLEGRGRLTLNLVQVVSSCSVPPWYEQ